ncbi:uncharacterized protein LOC134565369 isoform X2 [Prinia subflava]|uniref:uncharacterized protein LOC134565369 isoform X2 n=1 Tax=Prinia subflava TaxID=208062 RepID=UPI002FE01AAC
MAARGGLCPRKALSPPCPEGKPFPPFAASPWPKSPVRGRARAGPEARNAERDGPRSPLSAPERGVAQCPWAPSRQDRAAASSPREAEPDPQLLLSGTRQLPGAVTAAPCPGLVCSHLPRAQEATCPKQEGATAECAMNEDVGNEFCSSTGSAKQPPNSQNRSEAVNARKKLRQFLGVSLPPQWERRLLARATQTRGAAPVGGRQQLQLLPRRIPACPRLSPGPVRPPECPQSVPGVSPAAMEPRELLEALVAVVATLGELAALVTGPDWDRLPTMFPNSLRAELRKFTWHLCCTLNHRGVISLGQRDVTSLRQALAALEANPEVPWARAPVTAAVSAWQESVAALTESWDRLAGEATKLRDNHRNMGTWSEQGQMALRLLGHLVSMCDRATVFPWELLRRLGDIEATLVETREVSPSVPKALVAAVSEAEQLWEASTRLTTRHLLGTLADIHTLLVIPHDNPGGPGGRTVAARCQKAIEDISRLLGGQ